MRVTQKVKDLGLSSDKVEKLKEEFNVYSRKYLKHADDLPEKISTDKDPFLTKLGCTNSEC